MTATTPAYNLPYAQPSDARGAGANAMRDLALAVEAAITPSYAVVNVSGVVNLAANTVTTLPLPAPAAATSDWADTGDVWTYSGPARAFLITAGITTSNTDGGASGDYLSGAELLVNGAQVLASDDRIQQGAGALTRSASHSFAHVVFLAPGATVALQAQTNRPSSGALSLSLFSLAPRPA